MTKSQPGDSFQPGDVLNNTYRIESILGRGGLSEVYLARSEISGRRVAVKVLKAEFAANADYLVLMTREEDVREIRHDAVVRYFDNQRTPDGQVYLVMDYIDGPGLDEKLRVGGMPMQDLMVLAERLAEGLVAAHAHNIIHRDLSPDNVILRDGDPAEAVIIDFGIAKDTKPGAETIVGNEFAGKYAYAAPEQLNGHTDARSDIYALGAVLLAAYRGKAPEVGTNPVQVVRAKTEPVDTSGVPEPLKSLIDKMTAPDPGARLQSAEALLSELRKGAAPAPAAEPEPAEDRTVIAPPQAGREAQPKAEPAAREAKTPAAAARPAEPARRRGGALALVAVLVAVAAGAGAYLSGVLDGYLGPRYPVADPYALLIEKRPDEPPSAIGHVPSEAAQAALAALIDRQGGTADLTLSSGDLPESWGADVVSLAERIAPLDEYRMEIVGDTVTLTGLTDDSTVRRDLLDSLNGEGMPASLSASVTIDQGPRILALETARAVLDAHEDCGPLRLRDPPALGYGPQTPVVVDGKLGGAGSRSGLFEALLAVAGDRPIQIEAELLNPGLCQIETALPAAPPGGFEIVFGFGDRPDPNPSGRYFVGENPVIDVVIPADVTDGFLWVSVLDVSGNVFHLLPNLGRPENGVAALRDGADGPVPIRVAFPLAEATDNSKLAFQIDDSALGKSKVVVLHSAEPLFDELRPTTESAAGYAQALKDMAADGNSAIRSLDSAILVTAKP